MKYIFTTLRTMFIKAKKFIPRVFREIINNDAHCAAAAVSSAAYRSLRADKHRLNDPTNRSF
jgi:hypothetical protein